MTATNHTEHYDLSQFVNTDHPTFTGDYNGDMSKIDAAIYAASQSGGGGLSAVSHDATLAGDGTSTTPLGVADGTMITPSHTTYERPVNFNNITAYGVYDVRIGAGSTNGPAGEILNGGMLVIPAGYDESVFQIAFSRSTDLSVFIRAFSSFTSTWTGWNKIAFMSDIPDVSALTSRIATLESQVAALAAPATPSATGLAAEQLDS